MLLWAGSEYELDFRFTFEVCDEPQELGEFSLVITLVKSIDDEHDWVIKRCKDRKWLAQERTNLLIDRFVA